MLQSVNDALMDGVCEYGHWGKGYVHRGFAWASNWMMGNVLDDITSFVEKNEVHSIISVGHSLGGALATLFTLNLHDFIKSVPVNHPLAGIRVACHAFGAPPTV